jgi:hypothetical protein
MSGQTPQPPKQPSRKSRTPAERSEEFTATQRRLKQEAADRRALSDAAQPPRGGSGPGRA